MSATTVDSTEGGIDPRLRRLAGWAAYAAALSTALGAAFFAGLLAVGGVFGPLSDAAGAVTGLALLPLAAALYRTYAPRSRRAGALVLALGIAAGVALYLSSIVVVAATEGLADLDGGAALVAQNAATGVFGAWLVLVGAVEHGARRFGPRVARAGVVGGAGYVLVAVGARLFGVVHPTAILGAGLGLAGFVVWGLLVGRRLHDR